METYKASLNAAFSLCDVLKFSEEDVRLLYPAENPIDILQDLQQTHHIPLVILTMGGKVPSQEHLKERQVKRRRYP